MLRKESESVSEGNGLVPQQEEFGSGQPTLEDAFREIRQKWKEQTDKIRRYYVMQQSGSREQDARQPRLAIEADGPANTKTRERTEGAATAVQAMHGDSCTARKVQDGPKASTSFDMKAEPPALPCRDDVVVESGDAEPKSCLPSLEMRSPTTADGLVPTSKTSTATEITFIHPPLRLYSAEETNFKKSPTPYASYDSGILQKSNLPVAPYCRRVAGTNPGKIGLLIQAVRKVISAPARFWDRGAGWFVVRLCVLEQLVTRCSVFSEEFRWLSKTRPALMPCLKKVLPSRAARGYMSWRDEQRSGRRGGPRLLEY